MPKVICELENASTEINGIKFVPHANGKSLISEGDVGEPHLSIFLSIPGYVAEGDEQGADDEPKKEPVVTPKPESAAARKARLKAEQEAADAAAKAAAEREAAEQAEVERLAAEAAKQSESSDGDEESDSEVF